MDSYETFELVKSYMINKQLQLMKIKKKDMGLYQDDGLLILQNYTDSKANHLHVKSQRL